MKKYLKKWWLIVAIVLIAGISFGHDPAPNNIDWGTVTLEGNMDAGGYKIINLGDALNPKDAVNLDVLLNHVGVAFNYYLGDTTLDLFLTDSEDVLTETPDADPKTLTTIFFVASETDTPAPFTVKEGVLIIVHISAKVTTTAGKKDTQLKFQLGYVDSDGSGNFVQIGADSNLTSVLTAVQTSYELHIHVNSAVTVPDTKRLYMRVIADSGSGPTFAEVNVYFDDPAHHVVLPVDASILENYLLLAGGTLTGAVDSAAAISGAMGVINAVGATTLTTAQYGKILLMTTADEVTLPDDCDSVTGAWYVIWARDAEKIEVVVTDSADAFVLYGTALTADNELDSAGGAGNRATVTCLEANKWYVGGTEGIWVDGGAAD